ncbi:MAG: DUF1553 domain-containing protein, partial [Planctomycetales bacterium]
HPELLDWLAVEFIESGWNVKHVVRLLANSQAYRQASAASPELLARDPYNALYARQSRYRVEAEMVRDSSLSISGLMVATIGGPSVKPYQPAGYWSHLNFPRRKWSQGQSDDLYRRGLYTHWQRTFLHPSLSAFDAPSREECTAERPRSNTALQALALLNDPTYVEAARVFAARIVRQPAADFKSRLTWAFQQALQRDPTDKETAILSQLFDNHLKQYEQDAPAAQALAGVGEKPSPPTADAVTTAAWTSLARVLLNLHETITRQ